MSEDSIVIVAIYYYSNHSLSSGPDAKGMDHDL